MSVKTSELPVNLKIEGADSDPDAVSEMSVITSELPVNPKIEGPDFDPDAVREKYHQEKEKRGNPGNGQYIETTGDFSRYIDDPYIEPGFTREPVHEELEVLVIGGGFGGLLCAGKLREAGIDNFRIIEKGGDFGGTWYWNRYPGCACDVESYIYMPFLEATGYMPTEKYATAAEIFEHAQRIGKKFDMYRSALFQTQVKEMRWSETDRRWTVTTDRNDVIKARFVVTASGPLNRPKLPGIPGISSFKGHTFHTSRWDYEYTGGDRKGGLHKLANKRVAIIGTGATSLQAVPFLAKDAKQLFVFQRTPTTVGVRGNKPTDPEWVKTLKPGWQRERAENFDRLVTGRPYDVDLVNDGWTDMLRNLKLEGVDRSGSPLTPAEMARNLELADFTKGNEIRERVNSIVKDKKTADSLKSWYRIMCKRPGFHDYYLDAFNNPNVTLVDTQGRGVERITENSMVFDGVKYEVDCIIFATGFEVGTEFRRRAGFEAYGCGGTSISDYYANGQRTLHGFYTHGFPNYFTLGLSQNGIRVNLTDMLTEQSEHIVGLLKHMKENKLTRLEATAEAETEWLQVLLDKSKLTRAFLAQCTPGYYNGEGEVSKGLLINTYNGGAHEFAQVLKAWHADGQMKGLELS